MSLKRYSYFTNASGEDLQILINTCSGWGEVWRKLGLQGKSTSHYKEILRQKGVYTEHLAQARKWADPENRPGRKITGTKPMGLGRKEASRRNGVASGNARRERTMEFLRDNHFEIFAERSIWDGARVRRIIHAYNNVFKWLEERCYKCSNPGQWQEEPLKLEIDHANGVDSDNRLANLRFACPNCHSQTSTYRSKNRGKKGADYYWTRDKTTAEEADRQQDWDADQFFNRD